MSVVRVKRLNVVKNNQPKKRGSHHQRDTLTTHHERAELYCPRHQDYMTHQLYFGIHFPNSKILNTIGPPSELIDTKLHNSIVFWSNSYEVTYHNRHLFWRYVLRCNRCVLLYVSRVQRQLYNVGSCAG